MDHLHNQTPSPLTGLATFTTPITSLVSYPAVITRVLNPPTPTVPIVGALPNKRLAPRRWPFL